MNFTCFLILAFVILSAWVIWGSRKKYEESVEDEIDEHADQDNWGI